MTNTRIPALIYVETPSQDTEHRRWLKAHRCNILKKNFMREGQLQFNQQYLALEKIVFEKWHIAHMQTQEGAKAIITRLKEYKPTKQDKFSEKDIQQFSKIIQLESEIGFCQVAQVRQGEHEKAEKTEGIKKLEVSASPTPGQRAFAQYVERLKEKHVSPEEYRERVMGWAHSHVEKGPQIVRVRP